MPTYQYACTECGQQLEAVQSFSDPALTECPACQGKLRKVFNSVGIVFKGTGFYRNDSRAGASTGAGNDKAAGTSDAAGSAKKSDATPNSTSSSSDSGSGSSSSSSTTASASSSSGASGSSKAAAAS